jgi:hypothetical protein
MFLIIKAICDVIEPHYMEGSTLLPIFLVLLLLPTIGVKPNNAICIILYTLICIIKIKDYSFMYLFLH